MARLTDEWLGVLRPAQAGFEALALCLVALAALLFIPQSAPEFLGPARVLHFEGETGLERWQTDPASGTPIDFRNMARPQTVSWLIWPDVLVAPDSQPPAIFLSGPFSADIIFNGERIGQKGEPGADREAETAGPIETVTAIPARLIREEGNWIALRVSSHHAGYRPYSVVQGFFVTPYYADARRPIRYYLPLVVTGSGLAALVLVLTLRSRRMGFPKGYWLVAALAGLIVAGLAEVSRSLINYSYNWHQPRQALVLAGVAGFGLALLRFVQKRWPGPGLAEWLWLGLSALFTLAGSIALTGYDAKSVGVVAVLTGSTVFWIGWRGDLTARILALGLVLVSGYALFLGSDVIDRAIYVLVLALLAVPAIRNPAILVPSPARPPARLALNMTGRNLFLEIAEISWLKAAGNYTEVHVRSGGTHLDNRNLGQVLEALPPERFVRVHRSHAVYLDEIVALTNAEGSRYQLQLKSGESLPVSRSLVTELRERLSH